MASEIELNAVVNTGRPNEYHQPKTKYHQTSNISRTLVGIKIADHAGVVEASPVGAAPTVSSFST